MRDFLSMSTASNIQVFYCLSQLYHLSSEEASDDIALLILIHFYRTEWFTSDKVKANPTAVILKKNNWI